MPASSLALVLTAAVCHAIWNIAAKRVTGDGYLFVFWYNVFSAVLWLPIGLVLLARAGWPHSWALLVGPLVSAVIHVVYQLTLQTGYDRADLSVVYPVARGVGPLLSMVVAIAVLGERPGLGAALGGLVVITGIVVVATGPSRRRRPQGPGHASDLRSTPPDGDGLPASPSGLRHLLSRLAPGTRAGLAWGTATGAAIACYTLWDDHAMAVWGLLPVTYFSFSCTWQVAMMSPRVIRHVRRATGSSPLTVLRGAWKEVAVVAVLSPLAYILVLQAMRTVPVSLVAPARETSIVIGALLGWWLFKEPNPVRRVLGAVIVLGGITLIVV
jgi:drug/metabolite transporter (DMT)-like permease